MTHSSNHTYPHLSYCISSWGGMPTNRLFSLFSIQKRCVCLLFFNHSAYYETCAHARTFSEHMTKNDENMISLQHLNVQDT